MTTEEKCNLSTISDLDTFWSSIDSLTFSWMENFGADTYEFSTDDVDLALKLRYLTEVSKKFDSKNVFWELYHCEECEASNPEFPFHVRISA